MPMPPMLPIDYVFFDADAIHAMLLFIDADTSYAIISLLLIRCHLFTLLPLHAIHAVMP